MKFFRLVSLILILGLGACAAGSTQNVIIAPGEIDGVGKTANILVSAQDPELFGVVNEVERALINGLNNRRLFEAAQPRLDPSDYILDVQVISAKQVDEDSRVAFGGLAGKARVLLRVSLFEYGSEQAIGITEVEGTSSGGTIFAGTTEDAIQNAVNEVLNFIRPTGFLATPRNEN